MAERIKRNQSLFLNLLFGSKANGEQIADILKLNLDLLKDAGEVGPDADDVEFVFMAE